MSELSSDASASQAAFLDPYLLPGKKHFLFVLVFIFIGTLLLLLLLIIIIFIFLLVLHTTLPGKGYFFHFPIPISYHSSWLIVQMLNEYMSDVKCGELVLVI